MFALEFMNIAFMASGIVAFIAGLIGYFLLLRGEAFAGHALSHVGFAGATGASLIGLSPMGGLLLFSMLAGIVMGMIGPRLKHRDVVIGLVLSASMGLGLLFLHFYTRYATQISGLLFGNVFGVDYQTLYLLIGLACICCLVMIFFMRPLLFASLQPELAEAQGVALRMVSVVFLGLVAIVTAACVQVTGILLVFSLMIGPAAVAQRCSKVIGVGIGFSIFLAILEAWSGLFLSWWTDWPVSFWISIISFAVYLMVNLLSKLIYIERPRNCY